jgi:hypothetical protein
MVWAETEPGVVVEEGLLFESSAYVSICFDYTECMVWAETQPGVV